MEFAWLIEFDLKNCLVHISRMIATRGLICCFLAASVQSFSAEFKQPKWDEIYLDVGGAKRGATMSISPVEGLHSSGKQVSVRLRYDNRNWKVFVIGFIDRIEKKILDAGWKLDEKVRQIPDTRDAASFQFLAKRGGESFRLCGSLFPGNDGECYWSYVHLEI